MLGALLLTIIYNQMLSTNQLTEDHDDSLDLKILSRVLYHVQETILSARSFAKTALKFREDLIKLFIHLVIHQPFINFGDYW